MRRVIIYLVIFSMLIQIGCSSISQITLPIKAIESEKELKSLNYFGERLSSTIYLVDSNEVETGWLTLRENKIYCLSENSRDTSSIEVDKIRIIKFNDIYGGCIKGSYLGLGLVGLETLLLYIFASTPSEAGYAVLIAGPASIILGSLYGIFVLGKREFNFVHK